MIKSNKNKRIGVHKVLANLKKTGEFCIVTEQNSVNYERDGHYFGIRYIGNVSEFDDNTFILNPYMRLGSCVDKKRAINAMLGLPIGSSKVNNKVFLIDDVELPGYTGQINSQYLKTKTT